MVVRSTSPHELVDYDPMLWGPPGWKFLHFISFSYPTKPTRKHKRQFSNFFASVGHVLPCKTCRMHFQRSLRAAKRDNHGHFDFLENRRTLTQWLVGVHNGVNTNNAKAVVDYEIVQNQYETSANLCTSPTKTGSYTNLLENRGGDRGEEEEKMGDDHLLFEQNGLTRQEMIVSAVVLFVIVVACIVAVQYTCASCTHTQ